MAKDQNPKDAKPKAFIVRTPDKGFRGTRAGVLFFDGTARVTQPEQVESLRSLGYEVTEESAE